VNQLLLSFCALLATTGAVRAQEQYIPPPIVAPPPYQPFNYQLDQDLSARGHRNKVAGGLLIGFGSAALALGQGLVIYALATPQTLYRIDGHICINDGCDAGDSRRYDTGMIAGGAVLAFAGLVMNLIGIPVYAVGGAQMKKARYRLQATASGLRLEF
jgi:hypothetical protein